MTLRFAAALLICLAAPAAGAADFKADFFAADSAGLENPHDLKLSTDGHYLFVADVGNDRVAILDAGTLAPVGAFGADRLSAPHDIDFDAAGRAFVADTHNNRIAIYDMDGVNATFAGELKSHLRGPEGVLAHANGRVYAAGAWSGNAVAYEAGEVVAELTGLSSPHDLEQAPNGDIWLADAGNDRLLLLSPDLVIKTVLAGPPYDFDGVRYQDVLPDGSLIAADKNNHQVKVIGPDGDILLVLGTGRPEKGPGKFRTPEGIEVKGDRLWISDSGNDRVVVYAIRVD